MYSPYQHHFSNPHLHSSKIFWVLVKYYQHPWYTNHPDQTLMLVCWARDRYQCRMLMMHRWYHPTTTPAMLKFGNVVVMVEVLSGSH